MGSWKVEFEKMSSREDKTTTSWSANIAAVKREAKNSRTTSTFFNTEAVHSADAYLSAFPVITLVSAFTGSSIQ